jgi:predicted dehydrogenase
MGGAFQFISGGSFFDLEVRMFDTRVTRRAFMANSAAAAAGTMLAKSLLGQTAPAGGASVAAAEKKVGFALVGIGSLTTGQLIPALRDTTKFCKCVAFVTGHREKNLPVAERLGIKAEHVYTYENFDTIKDNPEVDVVYVVLPNSMHAEYTIRAAKAGKHVLCEKPMATSIEDCQKMIDACQAAKRKLMVAYRMQYEPLTRKLIEMCRSEDKIGKIVRIEATCGANRVNNQYENVWRLQKPLSGGGALMDMGIYALQSVRYLAGEEPIEVNTTRYDPPDGGNTGPFQTVEKNIVFDLKFASGLAATVTSGYVQATNRTQLSAEKGDLDLNPLMNYTGNRAYYTPKGGSRSEVTYTWAHHFATEMDDFAQCVLQDKQTRTPGEEGLRDMKIMYAAYDSAKSGKPVKLV